MTQRCIYLTEKNIFVCNILYQLFQNLVSYLMPTAYNCLLNIMKHFKQDSSSKNESFAIYVWKMNRCVQQFMYFDIYFFPLNSLCILGLPSLLRIWRNDATVGSFGTNIYTYNIYIFYCPVIFRYISKYTKSPNNVLLI